MSRAGAPQGPFGGCGWQCSVFSIARRPAGFYIADMSILPVAQMGADVLKHRAADVVDFADPALPVLVNDLLHQFGTHKKSQLVLRSYNGCSPSSHGI